MHSRLFVGIRSGACARARVRVQKRTSVLSLHRSNVCLVNNAAASASVPPLSDAQCNTIYALSTPPGRAGVAVFRVSGPGALDVWRKMVRMRTSSSSLRERGRVPCPRPRPWRFERCAIVDPDSNAVLDQALVVFFKGPKSFTTEDVLELHTHSGRALTAAILSALARVSPSCRPADPGEFTRRAFDARRLDLTQVEGLKDLIDADTEAQRRLAVRAAGGTVRVRMDALRVDIIRCLAWVEAVIDFGENDDVEDGVLDNAREQALDLHRTIQNYLSDHRRGEIIRSGIRLAIFGPPNAGKSSLLNFLAQREAAIVTPVPGTTRDILELSLDVGGLPVIVADTAGLRDTHHDLVEGIGIERAKKAIQEADVSLCVLALPEVLRDSETTERRRCRGSTIIEVPPLLRPFVTPETFVLLNKADLVSVGGDDSIIISTTEEEEKDAGERMWVASLRTGDGMTEFMDGFARALQRRYSVGDDDDDDMSSEVLLAVVITHARHRAHLETAIRHLEAFLDMLPRDVVLAAEELRYAARAVGKISGVVDVEDVLDVIFKDFCIGK